MTDLQQYRNPQAAEGTDWTVMGSDADTTVPWASAVDMDALHKIHYLKAAGIKHPDYPLKTSWDKTADLQFTCNGAAWLDGPGYWPVRASRNALASAEW